MFAGFRASVHHGYEPKTLAWVNRVKAVDPYGWVYTYNRFIARATAGTNWIGTFAEFLALCTTRMESALEGLHGLVTYDTAEQVGSPVHFRLFGVQRSEAPDADLETLIRMNTLWPQDVPGLTDYSMAHMMFVYTNYFGIYNEAGVGASGGRSGFNFRSSSGFRPTLFMNSGSLLYGGVPQWGFHLAYRKDENHVTAWREDVPYLLQSVINQLTLTQAQLGTLAADATPVDGRFIFTAGDPVVAGLAVNDVVTLTSVAGRNNNQSYTITGFTGTNNRTMLVTPPPMYMTEDLSFTFTRETPLLTVGNAVLGSIRAEEAAGGKLIASLGDPLALGYKYMQTVRLTGISHANNGRAFVIVGFTGTTNREMLVAEVPSTMAAQSAFALTSMNLLMNVPLCLLSAEPGAGNSPNGVSFWGVGPGDNWDSAKAAQCRADLIWFLTELGVYGDIEVPTPSPGQNCFGPNALADVLPSELTLTHTSLGNISADNTGSRFIVTSADPVVLGLTVGDPIEMSGLTELTNNREFKITGFAGTPIREIIVTPPPTAMAADSSYTMFRPGMRHYSRLRFPAQATTPAKDYNGWPVTDNWTGFAIGGSPVSQNLTDPITTVTGSDLVWINDAKTDALFIHYGLSMVGYTGGNGLNDEDINGRRLIVAVDTVGKRIQVKLNKAATGSGAIGGTLGVSTYTQARPYLPSGAAPFVPPRGGRLANFIPIYRSNGQDVLDAGATHNTKGSATSPVIRRVSDLPGTPIKAGTQGVILYSSWLKSIYAYLTFVAQNAGYAARDEARDPLHAPYVLTGDVNVGNGTVTGVTAEAPANGFYQIKLLAVNNYEVLRPDGTVLGTGLVGGMFTSAGLSFTLVQGETVFAAGDTFAVVAKTKKQGYMDLANEGGFADADVQPWKHYYTYADEIFTVVTGVQAGVWDVILLSTITVNDILAWGTEHLAQFWDCEQRDMTDPMMTEFRYRRWDDICGATGIKWQNVNHDIVGSSARGNGFTKDNMPRMMRLPNCDGFMFGGNHDNKQGGRTCIQLLQEQWDYCSGVNGDSPPPPSRVIPRATYSTGRYFAYDTGLHGQFQTPIGYVLNQATLLTAVTTTIPPQFVFSGGDLGALDIGDHFELTGVVGAVNNQEYVITGKSGLALTVNPAPPVYNSVVNFSQAEFTSVAAVGNAVPVLICGGGDPVAAGLAVGNLVTLTGVVGPNNNRTFEIAGFAGENNRQIQVTAPPEFMSADTVFQLTRETPPLTLTQTTLVSIAADPGAGRLVMGGGDPVASGIAIGDTVVLTDIAGPNLNVRYTVVTFTGTSNRELVVSPVPVTMAADTVFGLRCEKIFILRAWAPVDHTGTYTDVPKEKIDWTRTFSAWMREKGITKFASNLGGTSFGGSVARFVNQQHRGFLPYLTDVPVAAVPEQPGPIVEAWRNAVVTLGGTVSETRNELMIRTVNALMNTKLTSLSLWEKTRFFNVLAGENIQQVLVDVRQRVIGVMGADPPVFTANRGLTFNGLLDDFRTGFVPNVHHGGTVDQLLLGIYLRIEGAQATLASQFHISSSTAVGGQPGAWRMLARSATNSVLVTNLSTNLNLASGTVMANAGLTMGQRDATVQSAWRNGVQLGANGVTSGSGPDLPGTAMRLGASASTTGGIAANSGIVCDMSFAFAGYPMTAAEHAEYYRIVQTLLFDIGAAFGPRPDPAPWDPI